MAENCAICGCLLHRAAGTYARPTPEGRSHATEHHFVAERFYGRSKNRRGTQREGIFAACPWGVEGQSDVFCYECHEELLHNPVILPADMQHFAELVRVRGLAENHKLNSRQPIAGRVQLFQAIISRGIEALLAEDRALPANSLKRTAARQLR